MNFGFGLHSTRDASKADVLLGAGAVLGIVLMLLFLPSHHPYGTASFSSAESDMIERTTELVQTEAAQLRWRAEQIPQDELLMALQRKYGRKAAVDSLRHVDTQLPAFLWRVRTDLGEGEEEPSTARLDDQGRLWTLSRPEGDRSLANRRAVSAMQWWTEEEAEDVALSDTLMAEQFAFDADADWGALLPFVIDEIHPRLTRPATTLGPAEAASMARHHLVAMGHETTAFQADSVWLVGSEETVIRSRTRFTATEAIAGFSPSIEIEVAPAGMLWSAESILEDTSTGNTMNVGTTAFQMGASVQGIRGSVPILAYVLLFLIMAIVFFRKLNARLIDVNTSIRDAVLGGAFLAIMTALPLYDGLQIAIDSFWPRVGIMLLATASSGIGGGVIIWILSAATDSGMRATWPDKIKSLNLARRFRMYNIPVGKSLLRGAGLTGCIVGILMIPLLMASDAPILLGEVGAVFIGAPITSPLLFSIGAGGWTALWLMLLMLMGITTLIYRRLPNLWIVIPVATALFGILQIGPLSFEAQYLNILLSLLIGAALVVCFVRFDAFTCFVGIFLTGVLWLTAPSWMVLGFFTLDGGLPWVLFAGITGLGVAGVMSGREHEEVENYVPTYVRDLSQRERLQHEIELAQQVQQNLLPRSMPQIAGLDMAALCLPAQEVGGDYYDLIKVGPRRVGVVVGDVSGKGIQAAFFMTLAKGFLQTLARQQKSPREVVTRLNRLFCDNVPRGTFISMVYAVINLDDNTCTFVRAGHNPLVHRQASSGGVKLLTPGGMAIGLSNKPVFEHALEEVTISLQAGDALVLYTDGFTEAMNVQGTQLGSRRFSSYIERASSKDAHGLLNDVKNQVARFIEGAQRHDDMTVVVVQLKPSAVDGKPTSSVPEDASERLAHPAL